MDYQKTNWSYGDYVTPTKINNMENGLLSASQKINIDYTRTDWQSGDVVSADGLNNIEEGIERLSQAVDLVSEEAVLDEITPIDDDISITVNNFGQISATYTSDEDLDIIHTPGIVTQDTVVHTNISKTETHQLNTQESTLITPTKSQQTAVQSGKFTTGDVVVDAIPNQYIIPTGKKTISENGTNIDVAEYDNVDVQVSSEINNQNKTVNPTVSQQSITADNGYSGLGTVTVNAMPTGTAGTPTATKSSVSNHSISVTPSVTNTSGYIIGGTKTGTAVSVSASELVSGTKSISTNGTDIDVTNYSKVDVSVPTGSTINNQDKTVSPTESTQYVTADSDYTGLGIVTVNAISSTYVGSGIPRKSNADSVLDGPEVIFPAGYYASAHSDIVQGGLEGTPTATKGTVSNHSISVTPSVTNEEGWIQGGTKTGTAVTVSASELVSGNKTISANGTNIDVTNYSKVDVSVPSNAPVIDSLLVTPNETTQTFNNSSVDGYKPVTVNAISSTYIGSGITRRSDSDLTAWEDLVTVPAGYYEEEYSKSVGTTSLSTPTANKSSVSNHSVSVTPSITQSSGYITGGTKTGTAVFVSASELVSGTLYCDDSGTWDVTNSKYFDVGSGTVNNPTATKGTVSNHSVTVTPSVTSSEGWISGGTKTGTAVSVSASELVSGNKSISSNGTNIDVTNYESVDVDVFSPTLEPLRVYSDDNHNDNDTIITPQTGHAFSSVKVDFDALNFKFDVSETTLTEDNTSITFNNVFKEPFWYYIVCEDQTQFSSTNKYAFLVDKRATSSNPCIRYINSTTKTSYTYYASQSFNYVDSTFTITSTQSGVKFAANKKYTLVCMYNTRMYSTQASIEEIDSSSNEFEINYLAQRPYAIYGYTNDGDTKQSASKITSFFALIHDDYEDYINQSTNSCDGSYIITTGQLVECTSDDLSIKINREEKYGSYYYNHSITISSSNFDFNTGTWSIFYIPHNGSPGELVSPEPLYIDNSYGEGFTENGVYYAENYGYHGFNRIKVNVPQKVNYEEGIYTPQSDETNPTIYFSSDHYNPPNQIIMVDTRKYDPEDETYTPIMPKTNSNIEWSFTYYGWLGGDTRTSPEVVYGSNEDDVILATVRKTSIQSNNTYNQTSYSLTATGLDDWNDATNDYADGTKFMPHTTSSNTVWEGGRSYYWIALWAPFTAVF